MSNNFSYDLKEFGVNPSNQSSGLYYLPSITQSGSLSYNTVNSSVDLPTYSNFIDWKDTWNSPTLEYKKINVDEIRLNKENDDEGILLNAKKLEDMLDSIDSLKDQIRELKQVVKKQREELDSFYTESENEIKI